MTLRERLERYFKNQGTWIHSGEIQRIVAHNTTYTPSNCSRRLREMENDGILEVRYVKGNAEYKYKVMAAAKYWTNQESIKFFDTYSKQ